MTTPDTTRPHPPGRRTGACSSVVFALTGEEPRSPRRLGGPIAAVALALGMTLFALPTASWSQDPPRSLVKGCERGDAEKCHAAGMTQLARNPLLSRSFYSKACAGGIRKACADLHDASEELMDGDANDPKEALTHFETACGQDYGRSCTALASALWKLAGAPESSDANRTRAVSLWQKGCALKSRVGCRRMGKVLEKGEVVDVDPERALSFYETSCDLGLDSACADAGRLLQAGVAGSSDAAGTVAAVKPLRKACLEANHKTVRGDACLLLGQKLVAGDGVDRDLALAFQAFDIGCRDDHAGSCAAAGGAAQAGSGTTRDLNAATHYFGKACRLRNTDGCRELCRIQCDQGQPVACERLQKERWPKIASCAVW